MAKEKLGAKSEGVRLGRADSEWLDAWQAESAQDRSKVIRAAVRMLRIVTDQMAYEPKSRLIAKLAAQDGDSFDAQATELWAAVTVAIATRKRSK